MKPQTLSLKEEKKICCFTCGFHKHILTTDKKILVSSIEKNLVNGLQLNLGMVDI